MERERASPEAVFGAKKESVDGEAIKLIWRLLSGRTEAGASQRGFVEEGEGRGLFQEGATSPKDLVKHLNDLITRLLPSFTTFPP